ncbi:carbonic anhydrase [Phaeacidiphilus oryzae]|uniref:carbonic anhydrase n=1 Tax=Phaeacidiphilus oryzae TaxID=348818 RepID=UPI000568827C|nr:carbonic anhydrase [Phaeacidiphilus oryzae]
MARLLLTCADSRMPPPPATGGPATGGGPGDLFTVRTLGNLVPVAAHSADTVAPDDPVGAAVEYAVAVLGVRALTVCGHSGCGAMRSLLHGAHRRQGAAGTPLTRWLRHGQDSLQRSRTAPARFAHGAADDPLERLCLTNIEQQVENLRAHPAVRDGLGEGRIKVAGMYLDLARTQAFLLTEAGFAAVEDRIPESLAEKV